MKRLKRGYLLLATSIFLAAPNLAHADWAIGSKHKDMKGKTVVATGNVLKKSERSPGSYRQIEWYEFSAASGERICLVDGSLLPGLPSLPTLTGDPALLLMDSSKNVRLALIESAVGSIKVEVKPVTVVQCP